MEEALKTGLGKSLGTISAAAMLRMYQNYRRSGGKKHLKDFPEVRMKLKKALTKKDLLKNVDSKTIAYLTMDPLNLFDFLEIVAPQEMMPLIKEKIREQLQIVFEVLQVAKANVDRSSDYFDHFYVLKHTKAYFDHRQQRNLRRFVARMKEKYHKRLEAMG